MTRTGLSLIALVAGGVAVGVGSTVLAAFPKDPVKKCSADAVAAGTVCMDTYEASVWRVADPLGVNKGLVTKIQKGKATQADLAAGGATQLGTASDNYAPCTDNGQNCANDIYAVSLVGVTPAANITWFQAQEACAKAGKRLTTSAEWQVGANGTPDGAPCNVSSGTVAVTGTAGCVSSRGAFDMVGNLWEWVVDWVPLSDGSCPGWGSFSDDLQCFAGADTTTTGGPGALVRGGSFFDGTGAGPLAVIGYYQPSFSFSDVGFRCAR